MSEVQEGSGRAYDSGSEEMRDIAGEVGGSMEKLTWRLDIICKDPSVLGNKENEDELVKKFEHSIQRVLLFAETLFAPPTSCFLNESEMVSIMRMCKIRNKSLYKKLKT